MTEKNTMVKRESSSNTPRKIADYLLIDKTKERGETALS